MKKFVLASAIQGTTKFITASVHQIQNIDPKNQRKENQSRRTNFAEKKLIIGDKPKANASHGFLLLFVNIFQCILGFFYKIVFFPNSMEK